MVDKDANGFLPPGDVLPDMGSLEGDGWVAVGSQTTFCARSGQLDYQGSAGADQRRDVQPIFDPERRALRQEGPFPS